MFDKVTKKRLTKGDFPLKKRFSPLLSRMFCVTLPLLNNKTSRIMKTKVIIGMLLMALPVGMMAQDDDMYFTPSKAQKQKEQERRAQEMQERLMQQRAWEMAMNQQAEEYLSDEEADYHIGQLRDDDDYNRRGKNFATVVANGDTVYYSEEELRAEAPQQQYYDEYEDDMGYGYSGRLVRFHGGVRSPYYWDYYYDWAYDPWYRYGWTYDPWYYDYAISWGYRPWHLGYSYGWYGSGWYGGLYNGWYGGYYDPWYHGYYIGYGGWHHHHNNWVSNHYAYNRPGTQGALYGGRRSSSSMAGISAQRGSRNGGLASSGRGTSVSGSRGSGTTGGRGSGYSISGLDQMNNGRISQSSTRGSRNNTTVQQQNNNSRTNTSTQRTQTQTQRTQTQTQTQRQNNTYTPTTPSRSTTTTSTPSTPSRGGGISTGGGSMSTGGGMSGGGGGRGGR